MDPLIVLFGVFAVFIPALLLPGPDFVAVVRAAMTGGARAGLLTTLGVTFGLTVYATLSLLGLAAVLVEFQWLTWVVRVLGAAYLVYLGLKLLLARPAELDVGPARSARGTVLGGLLVTLTNPKAIVLFASVFATAVSAATPVWLLATMIALVAASAFVWYAVVSLCMASAPVVGRFARLKHWIERVAGACFLALAGKVLADARQPLAP